MTPFLRFDFPRPLRFGNPVRVIEARSLDQVRPALRAVQGAADDGYYAGGYVAYEAAPAFDPALQVVESQSSLPLLWFGVFAEPWAQGEQTSGVYHISEWGADSDFERYREAIDDIRDAVAAGQVYQVNHTFRLRARFGGDALAFYQCLRGAQPPPFAAYLDLGRHQVLSVSPELFFRRQDSEITTRPMKGTRQRGRWREEDDRVAAELAASEKDRAENVMIVDLLRNDLGRLAQPGSVRVPRLFEIERYPTVWQMTSTVGACLRPGIALDEIFGALFPCGSVTGAPKISATRFIARHETTPRQVYCGAIGYVTPYQEAVFSVAIRTALLDSETGKIEYGVGGGIVWDSDATAEYEEAWSKAAVLVEQTDFELLETLRWEDGAYVLLDRHLDRLMASADFLGFAANRDAVQEALLAHGQGKTEGAWRVRLCLSRDRIPKIESAALVPLPPGPQPVALAKTPVRRADKFLCHKTTRRGVYEAHRATQPDCFDVLLWNEEGELTEFTIGNLMIEQGSRLWTPPRECGLLDGTQRAELLAQGRLQERVLRREDLESASRVWLINSVRGSVPVVLPLNREYD